MSSPSSRRAPSASAPLMSSPPSTSTSSRASVVLSILPDTAPSFRCATCSTEISLQDELVSRSFSGSRGPAYLVRTVWVASA